MMLQDLELVCIEINDLEKKLPPGYDALSPTLRYGVPNQCCTPKDHPYKSKSIHHRSKPHD